jgi:hypothetical protein
MVCRNDEVGLPLGLGGWMGVVGGSGVDMLHVKCCPGRP